MPDIAILTPDPADPSYVGQWPGVLERLQAALALSGVTAAATLPQRANTWAQLRGPGCAFPSESSLNTKRPASRAQRPSPSKSAGTTLPPVRASPMRCASPSDQVPQ